ncbi:hypothetical protein AVEN_20701-1 [Araneus ventricosus]|uniref:Uncharacterized protein n=1 Tax=Araneus ventricosus TaxID=182803 RepID=A0A4Y2HSE7_ARAVE|nr:hypothetical protein AVEN_20701-1 [Araneus ventricosus]
MSTTSIEKHDNEASRESTDNDPHCSSKCPNVVQVFPHFPSRRTRADDETTNSITSRSIAGEELFFQDLLGRINAVLYWPFRVPTRRFADCDSDSNPLQHQWSMDINEGANRLCFVLNQLPYMRLKFSKFKWSSHLLCRKIE